MSKKPRKTRNTGMNTVSLSLDGDSNNAITTRLKERDVKHIKINASSELYEVYDFKDELGRGGFGKVISVVDRQTDKDWAMKIVSKAAVGNRLEAIYREIKILKMVQHPHIIYLDRVYESSRKIYLILELCYNVLSKVYKERKLFSESDTRKIIHDLTSAIAYLHKNDIVHRDLKLDNILIAKNPHDNDDALYIKITDFGLSIVKQGSGYQNMLHDCCGTILYMAPEVIASRSYSQQCDVWAAGVIMYTLLSGHYPFYSTNEQELTTMICETEPSFSEFSTSSEAVHLITKMLDKNPALRITAGEVTNHPWIRGKAMSPCDNTENVLDMMRLWRSDLMLPTGADCDWVSSAKAIEYSTSIIDAKNSISTSVVQVQQSSNKTPEDFPTDVLRTTPKQSMRLPAKSVRSSKPTNAPNLLRPDTRRSTIPIAVEPRIERRGHNSPSLATHHCTRHQHHAPQPALNNGRAQIPKLCDKGGKTVP